MEKATGNIIEVFGHALPCEVSKHDTVTITLEKGMMVIGSCKTCKSFIPKSYDKLDEDECTNRKTAVHAPIFIDYKGCGLWKPMKGAKQNV